MQTKQWTTIDKSDWPEGPWHHEPDKVQWVDEATGLPCLVVRNVMGAWCGYVGVPPGHAWHGVGFGAIDAGVFVHGGLTFAGPCQPDADESAGVCHVPDPGEADDVWWVGFDCNHCFDVMPVWVRLAAGDAAYRDLAYVRAEVTGLASQAKAGPLRAFPGPTRVAGAA